MNSGCDQGLAKGRVPGHFVLKFLSRNINSLWIEFYVTYFL